MTVVPWFEDFSVGDDFSDVPSVTLTEGHAAMYQAMTGDRMNLPLDHVLCQRVTGQQKPLAHPMLVCNMAVGQSTIPSQRVMGNLFYRGLVLRRPVYLGDTLSTTTRVVALRQNRPKPGRAASGMVALEMHTRNQNDDTVLLFWRCPMIPCRDPDVQTGHSDSFDFMPDTLDPELLAAAIPGWDLSPFPASELPIVGQKVSVEARDTVTLAPELVRMTLNLAMTHTDVGRSVYDRRLVYGGHTISLALAQVGRVVPGIATILGWLHCDHVGPVFEEDILRSEVEIEELTTIGEHRVATIHVESWAVGPTPDAEESRVLDWRLVVLLGASL